VFEYNKEDAYLKDVEKRLEEMLSDTNLDFTELELSILGSLIDNGADLDLYTEKELKCFLPFIKAEAATQNLDLRPNSEKFGGKTDYKSENYVPQKMDDLDENEVPGTILVQRTNTSDNVPTILEYKEENSFNQMLTEAKTNYNGEILKYFTINDKGNIVIAKWEHEKIKVDGEYPASIEQSEIVESTSEEGNYYVRAEEIKYSQYIAKYKMPFKFLNQLLVITNEPNFCMKIAEYVLDSKIIINIQEEKVLTVTDETRKYAVHNKDKKYLNYNVSIMGKPLGEVKDAESKKNYLKHAEDDENPKNPCTNYYTPEYSIVKIHREYTTNTYVFGIAEADTWIAHYKKETALQSSTTESNTTSIADKGVYKQVKTEETQPITDTTIINADENVTRFINETIANYEQTMLVPQEIIIGDAEYSMERTQFRRVYVKYKNGQTKEYTRIYADRKWKISSI